MEAPTLILKCGGAVIFGNDGGFHVRGIVDCRFVSCLRGPPQRDIVSSPGSRVQVGEPVIPDVGRSSAELRFFCFLSFRLWRSLPSVLVWLPMRPSLRITRRKFPWTQQRLTVRCWTKLVASRIVLVQSCLSAEHGSVGGCDRCLAWNRTLDSV